MPLFETEQPGGPIMEAQRACENPIKRGALPGLEQKSWEFRGIALNKT